MPDTSVKESKERIKAAIKNTGLKLESKKIVINLSPADTKKEGSMYDLPMAIGILIANRDLKNVNLEDTILVGELSLDGKLNKINGTFPITLEASKNGIKKIILPKENAKEASIVQDIEVIGLENLKEVISYLKGEKHVLSERIDLSKVFNNNAKYKMDFSSLKGQENVKRALEVAAARWTQLSLDRKPRNRQNILCKVSSFNTSKFKFRRIIGDYKNTQYSRIIRRKRSNYY